MANTCTRKYKSLPCFCLLFVVSMLVFTFVVSPTELTAAIVQYLLSSHLGWIKPLCVICVSSTLGTSGVSSGHCCLSGLRFTIFNPLTIDTKCKKPWTSFKKQETYKAQNLSRGVWESRREKWKPSRPISIASTASSERNDGLAPSRESQSAPSRVHFSHPGFLFCHWITAFSTYLFV